MSTNFYWINLPQELKKYETAIDKEILMHIGKRSAAGRYCFDCGTTLCKEGTEKIHSSEQWNDICPICKKKIETAICSFTWTFMKQKEICVNHLFEQNIIDEYGNLYTCAQFLEEIKDCIFYQYAEIFE